MARKRYNLAQTFLSTPLGGLSTDTTVEFTVPLKEGGLSGTDIPSITAGDYLVLKIDSELMYLTAYTTGGTTGTVLRAREQSFIANHDAGAVVKHVLTKEDIGGSNLWTPNLPDFHPLSDDFNDGVIDPTWVRVDRVGNSANLIYTEASGAMSLKHEGQDLNNEFHGLIRPLSGASFPLTLESCMRSTSNYAANYNMNGIGFSDNTTYGTGKGIISNGYTNSSNGSGLLVNNYTLANWLASTEPAGGAGIQQQFVGGLIYYRIKWESANTWSSWWSGDGISWIRMMNSASFTMTPTHVGLFHGHYGGNLKSITTWEYFRVF